MRMNSVRLPTAHGTKKSGVPTDRRSASGALTALVRHVQPRSSPAAAGYCRSTPTRPLQARRSSAGASSARDAIRRGAGSEPEPWYAGVRDGRDHAEDRRPATLRGREMIGLQEIQALLQRPNASQWRSDLSSESRLRACEWTEIMSCAPPLSFRRGSGPASRHHPQRELHNQ